MAVRAAHSAPLEATLTINTNTATLHLPLVAKQILKDALDSAFTRYKQVYPGVVTKKYTSVYWVDWRDSSGQIKFQWHNAIGILRVYIDFPASSRVESLNRRDAVLKALFERHAPAGEKPYKDNWGDLRYSFMTEETLTPNDATDIADQLGFEYTVVYHGDRELMREIGLEVARGETGKEWVNGTYQPYVYRYGYNM